MDRHFDLRDVRVQIGLMVHGWQMRWIEEGLPLGDFGLLFELALPLAVQLPSKPVVGRGPSKLCGAASEERETRWFSRGQYEGIGLKVRGCMLCCVCLPS